MVSNHLHAPAASTLPSSERSHPCTNKPGGWMDLDNRFGRSGEEKRQPVFLFTRGFCRDVNKKGFHTSPQSIERLMFVMWKHRVLCEARSAFWNIICENFRLQEVKITFEYPSTCLLGYLPELREMRKHRCTNLGQMNAPCSLILTFRRRNFLLNFSTPCI